MRIFIRYFLWFLSSLMVVLFYFLRTSVGHENLGYLVEEHFSEKTSNNIKIHALNIDSYPYITMRSTINGGANLTLKGTFNKDRINMNYHLKGKEFRWNELSIEESIDVHGKLNGSLSSLKVDGKGEMFDGNAFYSFIKSEKKFKDIRVTLLDAKSKQVLKFLKQPLLLKGRADIEAEFQEFSTYKKQGEARVIMVKAFMPTVAENVPFSLNAKVDFNDTEYSYVGKIDSTIGHLDIENGEYKREKKLATAEYRLHLKDLAYFEKFLKHKYRGGLDCNGTVLYNGDFLVKGETDTFGGMLEYRYEKEHLDLELKGVYLERLLKQFSYPTLLESDVFGSIEYDIKNKLVLINTELRKTHFVQNKITNIIYNTLGIDLLVGEYDKSSFTGGYENQLLSSELKIDDGVNHLYLINTKMNAKNNKVRSKFELKMQGEEVSGDIYGTLEDPKVSVDMRKLLKYQVDKQMGEWLGTQKSEVLKKELKDVGHNVEKKLKEVDLEEVKNGAKSLINSFF